MMYTKRTIAEITYVGDAANSARVLFKDWVHSNERGWEYSDQEMRMCTGAELHGIQHAFELDHDHDVDQWIVDRGAGRVEGTSDEELREILASVEADERAAELEPEPEPEPAPEPELTTTLGAITRRLRSRDDDGDVASV